MPGTEDVNELIEMAKASNFCKEMAIKSLSRVWIIANNREQLVPHRNMYTKALKALGATPPEKAMFYTQN